MYIVYSTFAQKSWHVIYYSHFAKDERFLVIYLLPDVIMCNNIDNIDANALTYYLNLSSVFSVCAFWRDHYIMAEKGHPLCCDWSKFAIFHWSNRSRYIRIRVITGHVIMRRDCSCILTVLEYSTSA